MDVFQAESLLKKMATVLIDNENATVFFVYDSADDSHNGQIAFMSIYDGATVDLHLNFQLDFNFVSKDGTLIEPPGAVTVTISKSDNPTDFTFLPDIYIANNLACWQRAMSLSKKHQLGTSTTIACAHIDNGKILTMHRPSGEVFGLNSINKIIVVPNPKAGFAGTGMGTGLPK
jgi:hypothetical protein